MDTNVLRSESIEDIAAILIACRHALGYCNGFITRFDYTFDAMCPL